MKADREHFHHILLAAGLSDHQVSMVIVMLSALLGAIGLVLNYTHVSQSLSFVLIMLCFLVYLYAMHHAFKFKKLVKRFITPSKETRA